MSLVATFIIAVSAFAQTNTYNMVLKLHDGTVITIGPNDLEQLDFKEGDVTVSGTNITTLMNSITAMQAQIETLKAQIYDNAAATAALQAKLAATENNVNNVEKRINENMVSIAKLENEIKNNEVYIEAVKTQTDENANDIASVADRMQANKVELQQAIAMVKAEEDVKIDQAVDDMYKMKEDSDSQIAELLDLIVKLEQRIKQLEEAE